MIDLNMPARDAKQGKVTRPFGVFTPLAKLAAAAFILAVTAQCKTEQHSKSAGASSLQATMQCTSPKRSNAAGLWEYTLTRFQGEPSTRSADCRLAKQLIDQPSNTILVAIGDTGPRSFEGVSECDEASIGAPTSNGRKARLSDELRGASLDAQLSSTLFALSLTKCFSHIFPSYRPDQSLVLTSVSMRWYHEDVGNRVAEADFPTVVAPVAALHRNGKLHALVCAKIVYGDESEEKNLLPHQVYNSCLNNFKILLPLENVNG